MNTPDSIRHIFARHQAVGKGTVHGIICGVGEFMGQDTFEVDWCGNRGKGAFVSPKIFDGSWRKDVYAILPAMVNTHAIR